MISNITIASRPAFTVMGTCVRTNMTDAPSDCERLWHEIFGPRMHEVLPGSLPAESYGISLLVDEKTGVFDYWATLPVPEGTSAPAGMASLSVPEGLYAELPVPSLHCLPHAYRIIYEEWLPLQRAYRINSYAPSLELYPADFQQTGKLTLYFPIVAVSW